MPVASVNGIDLAYQDTEGTHVPPVLLVHGHPFDHSMWRPQIERLSAAGHRVITPDLRGYGRSEVVPGSTTLRTFVDDLVGLLDHLGVDRVVLGGLSMGGQIVMEFHLAFPERIAGLLLAATSARADDERGRRVRYETADRLVREGMADFARETLPAMVAADTLIDLPEVAEHVHDMMRSAPPAGAAAALRGRAERRDHQDPLRTVTVPTSIVVGDQDGFTPVAEAELLHRIVPGSSLLVIEGAGHLPTLERPDAVGDALDRLLTKVREREVEHV